MKDPRIPLYLITGFLDSGKTTLLTDTLNMDYFSDGQRTVLLMCEDGETEYDPEQLSRLNTRLVPVQDQAQLNTSFLQEIDRRYQPERVLLEYNGMWPIQILRDLKLPKTWGLYQAIHVVDGVALVDREKCTGCGACAKACPNAIISIIPEHKRKPVVLCQNKDKGAQTRKACSAGCIGCMKCAKACPKQAITVENNLAYIDQEKCVGCGLCAKECPVGVIHVPAAYAQQVMSPAQEEAPAANA